MSPTPASVNDTPAEGQPRGCVGVWTFTPLSGKHGDGHFVLLDASDADRLATTKIYRNPARKRYVWIQKDGRPEYLHRVLLGLARGDGLEADHVNGDVLDNRRSNLRVTTSAGNKQNCGPRSTNTTGYRGVSPTRNGRFYARVMLGGKTKCLGTFDTPEAAAGIAAAYRAEHMPFATD